MDTKLTYLVTHGTGPAAIDQEFDLNGALAHACRLLSDGMQDVAIQDGSGKNIREDDLIACCQGIKTLTPDLRAVNANES